MKLARWVSLLAALVLLAAACDDGGAVGVGDGEPNRGVKRGTLRVFSKTDVDSLDPSEITPFMPEPDGLTLDEVERLFDDLRSRTTVIGAGLSGLAPDPANVPRLERLTHALGL